MMLAGPAGAAVRHQATLGTLCNMDASGYMDDQWRTELYRGLEAAVEAIRRQEPRATDDLIEPMVRQVAQAAITSWRNDSATVDGPQNSGWNKSIHESLDRMLAAVRGQAPETEEAAAVTVIQQVAQATLDAWHLNR